MQISATSSMVRWRMIAVALAMSLLWESASLGQLQFAAPSNQLAMPAAAANPLRSEVPVSPVQYQPGLAASSAQPAPPQLGPLVPTPENEASLSPGDLPPAPPTTAMELVPAEPVWENGSILSDVQQPGVLEPSLGLPLGEAIDQPQDSAIVYSTSAWFRRGFWYCQADMVVMLRDQVDNIVISADNEATAGQGGVGTKTLAPAYRPGTRITIGRFLGQDIVDQDYMMEFVFFGLFDYSETATLISTTTDSLETSLGQGNVWFTNDLTGGINGDSVPGFGSAQRHDLRWDSDFNSYEINFRMLGRPLRDHLSLQPNGEWIRHGASSQLKSLLLGLRAVSINELFRLDASFSNPVVNSTHQVETGNEMFGMQAGTELFDNHPYWSWGLRFKAGGLYNFADRRLNTLRIDGPNQSLQTQNVTKEYLAVLMEGGLLASYQLRPNLTIRAAYDALYVSGIATAPQNAGLQPGFPPFEVTGDALYHGMSFGFELLR